MSPESPPPSPSPALLARLDAMRPVRTRRPQLQLALVALASLGAMAALLVPFRPRIDVSSTTVLVVAGVCVLGFVAELWWALVPPRGAVLPLRPAVGVRVGLVWLLMLAALVTAGHDASADPSPMASARACLLVGAITALLPAALCLLLLRHAVALGGWRIGAVVGGAAGALAAVCLELHCANTHLTHVVFAHGGAALLPVALLAWVARR